MLFQLLNDFCRAFGSFFVCIYSIFLLNMFVVSLYLKLFLDFSFPYLTQPNFWNDPGTAMKNAYRATDKYILENSRQLGPGGSTAVTAIVIDGKDLYIANIGDSRAVICENGCANQITVDHEPDSERKRIEKQGGFVTNLAGNAFHL